MARWRPRVFGVFGGFGRGFGGPGRFGHLDAGLNHVSYVRLHVDGRPARAEAVGVAQRLPAHVPISLSTAARLVSSGVPVVVRSRRGERG